MSNCDVCKQEIPPGEGWHAWNMITGFQATIHLTCVPIYTNTGHWCRMDKHQECDGLVYIGNYEQACACICHSNAVVE